MRIATLITKKDGVQEIDLNKKAVFIAVLISGLIGGLVGLFTFWFINLPGYQQNRELDKKHFQVELFDHVLRTDDKNRLASLKLLIQAKLIEDPDSGLLNMLSNNGALAPDWSKLKKFESNVGRFNVVDQNGGKDDGGGTTPPESNTPNP